MDDLELPISTLVEKDAFYGVNQKNLNEDRPMLAAAKM